MLVFAGTLLAGLVLTVKGWRGRRLDDHPLCRRCGYDLVASGSASKCPECGSNLSDVKRAVRIGHRRRRPMLAGLGVLILLAGLGGSGAMYWLKSRNFDWNTVKPLWLLRREAEDKQPWKAMYAQREMLDRLTAGGLSQEQVDSVIDESLTLQADVAATWELWRGDFIEQAWVDGKTGDDRFKRYLETAIDQATFLRAPPSAPVATGGY